MTAVDVDALAKLREAATDRCLALGDETEREHYLAAEVRRLRELLLDEVRDRRALRDNVRELCDSAADGYVPVTWLRELLASVDPS